MKLFLAELINSIPPEFSLQDRKEYLIIFSYKNEKIRIGLFDNGQPFFIVYLDNDLTHRPSSEGPALQEWSYNGRFCAISYWERGKRHRPSSEGPAIQRLKDGFLYCEEYWENGKEILTKK